MNWTLSQAGNSLPTTMPFASWLSNNISYIDNGLYGIILLLVLMGAAFVWAAIFLAVTK